MLPEFTCMQAGAEFESASSVVSQLYSYTVGQRNEEVGRGKMKV